MNIDRNILIDKFTEMIDRINGNETVEESDSKEIDNTIINIFFTKKKNIDLDFLDCIKFNVGDYIDIPIDGELVRFDVKHVEDDRTYFVSHDIVGVSSMDDIEDFLGDYLSKMPEELSDKMKAIEHCCDNGQYCTKRFLTIPSYGNLFGGGYCTGADDMQFDGFKTGADRCKNLDGTTYWYWTDTRSAYSSANFRYVSYYGSEYNISADFSLGVVLGFCL